MTRDPWVILYNFYRDIVGYSSIKLEVMGHVNRDIVGYSAIKLEILG
jgi:hypothetical protein